MGARSRDAAIARLTPGQAARRCWSWPRGRQTLAPRRHLSPGRRNAADRDGPGGLEVVKPTIARAPAHTRIPIAALNQRASRRTPSGLRRLEPRGLARRGRPRHTPWGERATKHWPGLRHGHPCQTTSLRSVLWRSCDHHGMALNFTSMYGHTVHTQDVTRREMEVTQRGCDGHSGRRIPRFKVFGCFAAISNSFL